MADISNYLKTMLLARFGRDVRQTIHDAINAVNSSAEGSAAAAETAKAAAERAKAGAETAKAAAERAKTGAETAKAGAETAKAAAERAKTGAETARTGAETAKAGAETAKTGAETARTGAETARTEAETAKAGAETARTGAETARRIAESYAVGTYGQVREEDVTDNAKSYSEQSKNNALLTQQYYEKTKQKGDDAINAINKAFDNINQGLPRFVINPKDGKLYCTPSRFTFVINRLTGNLEWGLTL